MPRLNRTLLSAALIAQIAGAATAQFVVERTPAPPAAPALPGQPAAVDTGSKDIQTTIQINDGVRSEIRVQNGTVVLARVNGEDWPSDRVVRDGDQVLLLDDAGATVHRFVITAPMPPTASRFVVRPGLSGTASVNRAAPTPPTPGLPSVATWSTQEPPRVMLGVTFSEPSEALRAHLGLGDKPAIMVDGVIELLPAAKAGLMKHDVIVSIAGSDGATAKILREKLAASEPGTKLEIKVRRAGETLTLTPTLAAYDPARMGQGGVGGGFAVSGSTAGGGGDPAAAEKDDGWEELMQRYAQNPTDPGVLEEISRVTAERASRLAGQMQSRAKELAAQGLRAAELGLSDEAVRDMIDKLGRETERHLLELRDGRLFIRNSDQLGQRLEDLRTRVERQSPEAQARLEATLEARLTAMENRLESIERGFESRMERLSNLMDRMADRLERSGNGD